MSISWISNGYPWVLCIFRRMSSFCISTLLKKKQFVLVKKRRMPDSPNFLKQQKQICSSVNHFTLAYSTYLRTIDRVDLKVGLVFRDLRTKCKNQTNFEMVYDIYKTLDWKRSSNLWNSKLWDLWIGSDWTLIASSFIILNIDGNK